MRPALIILFAIILSPICCAAEPDARTVAPYPPGLTEQDALAGWIALFDGSTTFGWRDAKLEGTKANQLHEGTTTTEFADFDLRVNVVHGDSLTLAGEKMPVRTGWNTLTSRGRRGSIELGADTMVEAVLLKPAALKSLFNGQNLVGWDLRSWGHTKTTRPAEWKVEQGVIHARGGSGALEYAPRTGPHLFGDFIAQFVVRTCVTGTNGGVFIRNEPGKTMMGYEAQLHNTWYDHAKGEHGYTTGGIDDRQQARRAVARDLTPFRMTVVAHGPHFATWVNGYQVTDWTDTREPNANPRSGLRLEPGTLQLQAHDAETDIEFHGVYLQELPIR